MGAGLAGIIQTPKDYRKMAIDGDERMFQQYVDSYEESERRANRMRRFFGIRENKDIMAKKKMVKKSGGKIQYDNSVWDTPDDDGKSPLHHACEGGYYQIVKILCEKGAGKDRLDAWGRTPLWYASAMKRVEVVKLLAQEGADLNLGRVNESGYTYAGYDETWGDAPLHRAAEKGHLDVVMALVQAGADKDRIGMGAFVRALHRQTCGASASLLPHPICPLPLTPFCACKTTGCVSEAAPSIWPPPITVTMSRASWWTPARTSRCETRTATRRCTWPVTVVISTW